MEQINRTLEPRTNHLGLLLLLVPAVNIYILGAYGQQLKFPLNEFSFLRGTTITITLFFLFVWLLAHNLQARKSVASRNGKLAFFSLWLIWAITSFSTLAFVNQRFDSSADVHHLVKVVSSKARYSSSIGRAGSTHDYCHVTFEPELHGLRAQSLKIGYCELLRPGIDGVRFTVRSGYLGWPWISDYSAFKNIEL